MNPTNYSVSTAPVIEVQLPADALTKVDESIDTAFLHITSDEAIALMQGLAESLRIVGVLVV